MNGLKVAELLKVKNNSETDQVCHSHRCLSYPLLYNDRMFMKIQQYTRLGI